FAKHPARQRPLSPKLVAAGLLIFAVVIAVGARYACSVMRSESDSLIPLVTMVQATSTGNMAHAAISPDGNYVAYAQGTDRNQSVWVQQLATNSVAQIIPPAEE